MSPFLERRGCFLPSGRAAIAAAIAELGVGSDDRVLVPAYHCGSLVEPIVWSGAAVDFYRLKSDLRIDIDDVRSRTTGATRCLVVVHYFGFQQPLDEVMNLIDDHGMALLEDCAHAFFGTTGVLASNPKSYAIASVKKFFPVEDGGILLAPTDQPAQLRVAGISREARAVYRALERSAEFGRLGPVSQIVGLISRLRSSANAPSTAVHSRRKGGSAALRWFIPDELERHGTRLSRWLLHHANIERARDVRRHNFRRMCTELSGLSKGRPLFDELSEHVVPYMFPFLLRYPESGFPELKERRVPVLRWEEIAESDCPVSGDYLRCLAQLPCHQELTRDELDKIIWTTRDAMK